MLRKTVIAAALLLAGCEAQETPEGCPVMVSDLGRQLMQQCIASYHAEKARQEGRPVTTCRSVGATTTCVTE